MKSARRGLVAVCALALAAADAAGAQGPGRTGYSIAIGGLPIPLLSVGGTTWTGSHTTTLAPRITLRADLEAHSRHGDQYHVAPCPDPLGCPEPTPRNTIRKAQLLSAGLQWFELPRREGIFLVAQAGIARVTGDGSGRPSVVLQYQLGGGILFPVGESAGFSIETRRVVFPRRFEESVVWPVTLGVHF